MAEETTSSETVKITSDGQVRITLEKYQELLEKANEPKVYPQYNTTHIEKTPAMQASDNKMYGAVWMGGGASLFLIGAMQFVTGVRQTKSLL